MRVIVNPKYAHLQKEIEEIPRSFQEKEMWCTMGVMF